MIDQKIIDRINALARKSRTPEGLTPEEALEQQRLRRAYVEAFRASLRTQLDHTTIVRPDGSREKLSDRKKKKP